ncbi:MAG: hypothetical protein AAGA36_14160 [Pseudomonadota bacterium]
MLDFILLAAASTQLTLNDVDSAEPHQQVTHYAVQACASPNLNEVETFSLLEQQGWQKDGGLWSMINDFWIKKTKTLTIRVVVRSPNDQDANPTHVCQFVTGDASVEKIYQYVSAKIGTPNYGKWDEEERTASWTLNFDSHQAGFFISPGVNLEAQGRGVMISTVQRAN